jgi:hypothetical protein
MGDPARGLMQLIPHEAAAWPRGSIGEAAQEGITADGLTRAEFTAARAAAWSGYETSCGFPPPGFTCPRCGRATRNDDDVRERYCGACHEWTSPDAAVARSMTAVPYGHHARTGVTAGGPDRWRCLSCENAFEVPPGTAGPALCPDHSPPEPMVPDPARGAIGAQLCIPAGAVTDFRFEVTDDAGVPLAAEALREIAGLTLEVSGEVDEGTMLVLSRALGLDPAQAAVRDLHRALRVMEAAGASMAQVLAAQARGFERLGGVLGQAAPSWAQRSARPLEDLRAAMDLIAASAPVTGAPEPPDAEPWDDAMSWTWGMPEL